MVPLHNEMADNAADVQLSEGMAHQMAHHDGHDAPSRGHSPGEGSGGGSLFKFSNPRLKTELRHKARVPLVFADVEVAGGQRGGRRSVFPSFIGLSVVQVENWLGSSIVATTVCRMGSGDTFQRG